MFVFSGDPVITSNIEAKISILFLIITIANVIPTWGAAVRRLHDTDKSGWFVLISFIPIIGLFIIFLLIGDGSKGKNRFGPKPKK